MALKKTNYVNGKTVISAENLNDIQDAVLDLESKDGVGMGSIGTPVVRMDAGTFRVPGPVTLTLYVDAATLADIPALVKDKVPGYWPANTTVVYKNSTTGEVIEG